MKTYLIAKNENPLLQKIDNGLKVNGANDVKIVAFEKITPEQIKESAADAEIVVASPTAFLYFSKEHMENMPRLKLISTLSVGTDWIDLKAARERGIVVSNEKGVNSEAVAEHLKIEESSAVSQSI